MERLQPRQSNLHRQLARRLSTIRRAAGNSQTRRLRVIFATLIFHSWAQPKIFATAALAFLSRSCCLQVTYDETQPQNSRVVSVQVQCASCDIPTYSELQRNATYKVLLNDFIAKGGDGFHMFEGLEITSLGTFTHTHTHILRYVLQYMYLMFT